MNHSRLSLLFTKSLSLNQNNTNIMKVIRLLVLLLLLSGCFASKQATTEARRPAKFDFAPPSTTKVGETGITIALINPSYIHANAEYLSEPFSTMASNMGTDFKELLTAKGFTLRGPYDSRGKMTFTDKTSSDFAIVISIDLQPTWARRYKYDAGMGVLIAPSYKMNGDGMLGGRLVISAESPRYGELLWTKSIDLDKSKFSYQGAIKWDAVPSIARELELDNVFYNNLCKELEKFYAQAMNLTWEQIDANEMRTIAAQAKKADSKG
jgi:hypothetical protein